MNQLRRVLYLDAALWALAGVLLALVPRWVLVDLAGLDPYPEYVWVRAVGILAFSVALLMVLAAQNAEQAWFWTWAFIFAELNLGLLFTVKALFAANGNAGAWWIAALACILPGLALLWGVARAYAEAPDK